MSLALNNAVRRVSTELPASVSLALLERSRERRSSVPVPVLGGFAELEKLFIVRSRGATP